MGFLAAADDAQVGWPVRRLVTVGVLKVQSFTAHAFDEQQRGSVQLLAGFLGAAIGRGKAHAERMHAERAAQAASERFGSVLRAATECST